MSVRGGENEEKEVNDEGMVGKRWTMSVRGVYREPISYRGRSKAKGVGGVYLPKSVVPGDGEVHRPDHGVP